MKPNAKNFKQELIDFNKMGIMAQHIIICITMSPTILFAADTAHLLIFTLTKTQPLGNGLM